MYNQKNKKSQDLMMFIFQKILKTLVINLVLITNCVKSNTVEITTVSSDFKIDINGITNETKKVSDMSLEVENITCIGAQEYCNMTREDYIMMLDEYIYPKSYEWGLIAAHSVVFLLGLLGNALVCIAVYRNKPMRSNVTYCCLVNLAVADFLVILLCLPSTVIWDVTETWFLGDTLCKILPYFQSVSVTVSVLTLTFIALDRWYAIVYPFKSKATPNRPKTKTILKILVIWTVALVFNCPDLIYLTTVKPELRFDLPHLVQCQATWSDHADLVWHIGKFVFIYSSPLLLITVAYLMIALKLWKSDTIPGQAETKNPTNAEQNHLRSRRNVAKMLVVVVVTFAVCYLPVHLLSLLRYTGVLQAEHQYIITPIALMSHFLCYANSAINPLIYNFMCGKFRKEFRRSFCCSPETYYENSTTLTMITKTKRPEFQSLTQRTTSFINGSRNGYT